MRSTIRSLLLISFSAWTAAGCVSEATSPAGLQATEQPLQREGVSYLRATGTAENPMFTFYDQNKVVIGDGRTLLSPQLTEIQWLGHKWESTGGAFSKNGVVAGSDGADAVELDTVLTVFELSLDQAFPTDASSPNDQAQPNACLALCSRPFNRCRGGCTGWVCSRTDGSQGFCQPPSI